MGPTILFQLTFTFIYNIFSKKIFNFNKINEFLTNPKESNSIHEVVYQRKRKRPKTHATKFVSISIEVLDMSGNAIGYLIHQKVDNNNSTIISQMKYMQNVER